MLTWPSAKPPLKTRTFKGKTSSSPSQPKTNNKHPTCPSCKSEAWETTSRGGGQMLRKIQSPTYLFTAIHFLLVVLGSYQLGTTKKIKYITIWLHRWRRYEVPVFYQFYFEHIENLRTIYKGDVVFLDHKNKDPLHTFQSLLVECFPSLYPVSGSCPRRSWVPKLFNQDLQVEKLHVFLCFWKSNYRLYKQLKACIYIYIFMYTSYTCIILSCEYTNIIASYDLTWVWLKLIGIIPGLKAFKTLSLVARKVCGFFFFGPPSPS